MKKPAVTRSLNSLAHPITIGAVALLLINDHVLRVLWPSWWAGKLGDLAWLAFGPLITALLLALIFPQNEKRLGWLAFTLIGLIFASGKTVPPVHALIVRILETVLNMPIGLRMDPTDLFALPGLLIGWYVWKQPRQPVHNNKKGWVFLVVGTLATLANGSMAQPGVNCLIETDDGILIADAVAYSPFYSEDGGLTWIEGLPASKPDQIDCSGNWDDSWVITDPNNDLVQYRFNSGRFIERSADGGKTWQREFSLAGSQARAAYYERTRDDANGASADPLDALVHGPTGHVVVAMGHDGVLVRTTDGVWQWIGVGPFYKETIDEPLEIFGLLIGEILLACFVGAAAAGGSYLITRLKAYLAVVGSVAISGLAVVWTVNFAWSDFFGNAFDLFLIALPVIIPVGVGILTAIFQKTDKFSIGVLAISLNLMIIAALSAPAIHWTSGDYTLLLAYFLMGVSGVGVFGIAVVGIDRANARSSQSVFFIIAASSLVAFMVPYVLWAVGVIGQHWLATLIAWIIAFLALFIGNYYVRKSHVAEEAAPEG